MNMKWRGLTNPRQTELRLTKTPWKKREADWDEESMKESYVNLGGISHLDEQSIMSIFLYKLIYFSQQCRQKHEAPNTLAIFYLEKDGKDL
jgi:hypothetical protein